MSELRLSNIEKTYGQKGHVFKCKIPEFVIEEGRIHTLLGPSGCGKTTLLKIIAGLEPVDAGTIMMDGRDVTSIPIEGRHVGMVFQKPLLFPHMTVLENVVFPLLKNHTRKEATAISMDMLEQVGLSGHTGFMPGRLSGGQAQRVAFARALVLKPGLMLLDEPLSALDQTLRQEMVQLIKDINKSHRMTMVHVTHDVQEAVSLADRMTLMHMGGILESGEMTDLLRNPKKIETARMLGFANSIVDDGVTFAFRPSHARIIESDNEDMVRGNTIPEGNDVFMIDGVWKRDEHTVDDVRRIYSTCFGPIVVLVSPTLKGMIKTDVQQKIVVLKKDCIQVE